jgi:hypothetical protein
MRMGVARTGCLALALALIAAPTQAQDTALDRAMAALREAEQARAEAVAKLEKADRLVAEAKQLIADSGGAVTPPSLPAQTSDQDRARTLAEAKASSALCRPDACADVPAPTSISALAKDVFGLRRTAFEREEGALFRLEGGASGNYAEIGGAITDRTIAFVGANQLRAVSDRYALSFLISTADDDSNNLGVYTDKGGWEGNSDWAINFDWRRSVGPRAEVSETARILTKALEQMYVECIAASRAEAAESRCDPDNPSAWLQSEGRARKYFLAGVAPVLGLTSEGKALPPRYYYGAQGRFGFLKESFFPLSDPGGTGVALIDILPPDLGAPEVKPASRRFNPFLVKAYGGIAVTKFDEKGWDVGLAGSLAYQRSVRYPKDTEDVDVCYEDQQPQSTTRGFVKCSTVNLAVPYLSDGLVFGAGVNVLPPRTWLGRPYAGLFGNYDTGLDQWSVSAPLAFAVDESGKLKAGVKVQWRSDGETHYGEIIPARGVVSVFLAHDLEFPFVP